MSLLATTAQEALPHAAWAVSTDEIQLLPAASLALPCSGYGSLTT
jgi:hypothetical protein